MRGEDAITDAPGLTSVTSTAIPNDMDKEFDKPQFYEMDMQNAANAEMPRLIEHWHSRSNMFKAWNIGELTNCACGQCFRYPAMVDAVRCPCLRD